MTAQVHTQVHPNSRPMHNLSNLEAIGMKIQVLFLGESHQPKPGIATFFIGNCRDDQGKGGGLDPSYAVGICLKNRKNMTKTVQFFRGKAESVGCWISETHPEHLQLLKCCTASIKGLVFICVEKLLHTEQFRNLRLLGGTCCKTKKVKTSNEWKSRASH